MKKNLEKYIQENLDDLDRKKPDPSVLNRVLEQMQAKETVKPRGIVISFQSLKWAAACIAVVVSGIAVWQMNRSTRVEDPVIAVTPPPVTKPVTDSPKHTGIDAVDADMSTRKDEVIAKLKTQQQASFAALHNMESAATRITAISEAAARKNNGNDVVDALLQTLNNDPNTNVRLAALDGLSRFYREGYVRKKLIASLKKQPDPVVQITLIGLLTRMKESAVLSELEKMVNDDKTIKAVRDCAYSGILQLQS